MLFLYYYFKALMKIAHMMHITIKTNKIKKMSLFKLKTYSIIVYIIGKFKEVFIFKQVINQNLLIYKN